MFPKNAWYVAATADEVADKPLGRMVCGERIVFYRSDAASAVEAGNDIRTALLCFACDASHGYERTHEDSLSALGRLLAAYMLSPPLFQRDVKALGPLGDFPPAEGQITPE